MGALRRALGSLGTRGEAPRADFESYLVVVGAGPYAIDLVHLMADGDGAGRAVVKGGEELERQVRLQLLGRQRRAKMKRFAKPLAAIVPFASSIGCGGQPAAPKKETTTDAVPTGKVDTARPEITLQLRQYPQDGQPWNRGDAIRIRLDVDRLRAHDLSGENVMKALEESRVVGSPRPADPPPGVVFVSRLSRPDLYENVVLKASAEGEIVRLKDVAIVERVGSE